MWLMNKMIHVHIHTQLQLITQNNKIKKGKFNIKTTGDFLDKLSNACKLLEGKIYFTYIFQRYYYLITNVINCLTDTNFSNHGYFNLSIKSKI